MGPACHFSLKSSMVLGCPSISWHGYQGVSKPEPCLSFILIFLTDLPELFNPIPLNYFNSLIIYSLGAFPAPRSGLGAVLVRYGRPCFDTNLTLKMGIPPTCAIESQSSCPPWSHSATRRLLSSCIRDRACKHTCGFKASGQGDSYTFCSPWPGEMRLLEWLVSTMNLVTTPV